MFCGRGRGFWTFCGVLLRLSNFCCSPLLSRSCCVTNEQRAVCVEFPAMSCPAFHSPKQHTSPSPGAFSFVSSQLVYIHPWWIVTQHQSPTVLSFWPTGTAAGTAQRTLVTTVAGAQSLDITPINWPSAHQRQR